MSSCFVVTSNCINNNRNNYADLERQHNELERAQTESQRRQFEAQKQQVEVQRQQLVVQRQMSEVVNQPADDGEAAVDQGLQIGKSLFLAFSSLSPYGTMSSILPPPPHVHWLLLRFSKSFRLNNSSPAGEDNGGSRGICLPFIIAGPLYKISHRFLTK